MSETSGRNLAMPVEGPIVCATTTDLSTAAFRAALENRLQTAERSRKPHVDIRARDLHLELGVYPNRDHRMPVCCAAMRNMMAPGDAVLDGPPKGKGASLLIRYKLPRKVHAALDSVSS